MPKIKVDGKIIDTMRALISDDDKLWDLGIKCKRAKESKVWFEFDGLNNDEAMRLLADSSNVVFYEENTIALSSGDEISENLFNHINGGDNLHRSHPYHIEKLILCDIYHYYHHERHTIKIESKESLPTKYYCLESEFLEFWGLH